MNGQILSRWVVALCCVMLGTLSWAQVKINEPEALTRAMATYGDRYDDDMPYQGWSVLLTVNGDRRVVDQFQRDFEVLHPEYAPYVEWKYEQPYYKLYLGAFADETRAKIFMAELSNKYKGLIAVRKTFPRKDILAFRRVVGS